MANRSGVSYHNVEEKANVSVYHRQVEKSVLASAERKSALLNKIRENEAKRKKSNLTVSLHPWLHKVLRWMGVVK